MAREAESLVFNGRWVKLAHQLLDEGYSLTLSTFRISMWEDEETMDVRSFLANEWSSDELTLVVGLPDNNIQAELMLHFCSQYPTINWQFQFRWHAKYLLAKRGREIVGYLGSHNFTYSNWCDVSIRLTRDQYHAIKKFHDSRQFLTLDAARASIQSQRENNRIGFERLRDELASAAKSVVHKVQT